jgi:DNA-binding response OmpR family regulator
MVELQARMEAVLRRAVRAAATPETITLGPVALDLPARRVTVDGAEVALTRKEFDILTALARRPGVAVPRDRLIMEVWQTSFVGAHSLDVHVASLRAKLGDPSLVETVRGVGYRLRRQ